MTRLNEEGLDKLEQALAEAHRSRQDPSLGADWARHVMRDIRQEAIAHRQPMMSTWIDLLVWRAAAVAAVFALIFASSMVVYSSKDRVELAALLSDEFEAGAPLIE